MIFVKSNSTMKSTRVKAKHARQIRYGILQARFIFPRHNGFTRLGWKAFCRESNNYLDRLMKEPNPFV